MKLNFFKQFKETIMYKLTSPCLEVLILSAILTLPVLAHPTAALEGSSKKPFLMQALTEIELLNHLNEKDTDDQHNIGKCSG